MDRSEAVLRPFFPTAAIVVVAGWIIGFSPVAVAFADDLGSNKSELVRGLLPTVVNISVRKDEPPAPPVTAEAAAPPPTLTPTPGTPVDTGSGIKAYVGSGFVIDPSGLIVTNYHVVEYAFDITVTFSDGSRLSGKMLSASRTADLALVKVEPKHPLKAAHWGDSDKLQVGDQVFAAGDPFGIGLSVSAGIVSGLNRDIQNSPYDDLIQTDASINHGNSGGPLFDMQGNVIGVNSTIISPTTGSAGLGFAIPSSSAHFVIDQLRTFGWVHPAWIGIKVQTVTREIADAVGMPEAEGSIVAWVLPDGPAKKAGLAIGDVILRFDGSALTDERELLRDIAHTPVGQTVKFLVRHDAAENTVLVTTEAWPRNQWDKNDAPEPVRETENHHPAESRSQPGSAARGRQVEVAACLRRERRAGDECRGQFGSGVERYGQWRHHPARAGPTGRHAGRCASRHRRGAGGEARLCAAAGAAEKERYAWSEMVCAATCHGGRLTDAGMVGS